MDEANAHGVVFDGEPPVDRYLLQFWPAPAEPDRVVRRTSDQAAYWHKVARDRPPPPTPGERAAAARAAREEEARAHAEIVRNCELRMWAGRLPTERLRRVGGNVHGMRMLDVHLVHAIARVDDGTRREIARWAAHRAYALAGLADVDWIAPALRRLLEDPNVPRTTITLPEGTTHNALQQAFALPALLGAAEPDSLQVALDALDAAAVTHGTDHRAFLDEVRDTWPRLGVVPPAPAESFPPPFPSTCSPGTRPTTPRRAGRPRQPKHSPPLRRPTRRPRPPCGEPSLRLSVGELFGSGAVGLAGCQFHGPPMPPTAATRTATAPRLCAATGTAARSPPPRL
ncbi:hypothetical protein OG948_35480 (plasmid) [Embleya sp. NBC_00888]|uniref:hypothetical protein n=1 Tax=Embleya sp. NBC_00888 TaxID=2975960 RepID=UPI002F914B34|nr:hypothetical protein OG948_35480 [Embleya sp. NBC_00888]